MPNFRGQKALIMGLGSYKQGSGVASLRYLHREGAKIRVTDMKTAKDLKAQLGRIKNLKGVKYILGRHRKEDFFWADLVVKNPGVPKDSKFLKIAKKRKIPIFNDLTLFLEEFSGGVIGITGTRGKSTTTTLVYEILKKAFPKKAYLGGNIKISPLVYLGRIKDDAAVVLEISSWQANGFLDIKYSPQIAVVLNVMNDHMNMYKTFGEYAEDKSFLWKFQNPEDFVVLNLDDKYTREMGKHVVSQRYWISKKYFPEENGAFVKNGWFWFRDWGKEEKILKTRDLKIIGEHNYHNILAAIVVARLKGVDNKIIKSAVASFRGLPYRLELVRERGQIKFYNDTTATTPDGALAALKSFKNKVILICGGVDKELEFKEMALEMEKKAKKVVLLPGTATEKMLKYYQGKYVLAASMRQAVKEAFSEAKKGDIVLLSPGGASFGLFKNEFDRGDQFNREVRKL